MRISIAIAIALSAGLTLSACDKSGDTPPTQPDKTEPTETTPDTKDAETTVPDNSAAPASLQQQGSAALGALTDKAKTLVPNTDGQIDALKAKISELTTQLQTSNNELSAAEKQISEIEAKRDEEAAPVKSKMETIKEQLAKIDANSVSGAISGVAGALGQGDKVDENKAKLQEQYSQYETQLKQIMDGAEQNSGPYREKVTALKGYISKLESTLQTSQESVEEAEKTIDSDSTDTK